MTIEPAESLEYAVDGATSPLCVMPSPIGGLVQSNKVFLGFPTSACPELGSPAAPDLDFYQPNGPPAGGPGGGVYIEIIIDDNPAKTFITTEMPIACLLDNGSQLIQYFVSSGDGEVVRRSEHVGAAMVHVRGVTDERPHHQFPMLIYNLPRMLNRRRAMIIDFGILNIPWNPPTDDNPYYLPEHLVRVTIDGVPVADLEHWKPYFVNDIDVGDHTIELELLLRAGNTALGCTYPFARTAVRTFKVV